MSVIAKLLPLRQHGGAIRTHGLDDATIERLASDYPELAEAIDDAHTQYQHLKSELPDLLKLDETAQLSSVQSDFVGRRSDS